MNDQIANQPEQKRPLDDDLEAAFARMEKAAQKHQVRRERLEKHAATQPQTVACLRHPNQILPIDIDESSRETSYKCQTEGIETFVIRYSRCPECALEEKTVNEQNWLKATGVPALLLPASFSTFRVENDEDASNLGVAKQFVAKGMGFLMMTGNRGDGKSFLAAAILRENLSGKFVTHNNLLLQLRDSYHDHGRENVIKSAQSARCLVIDDFGLSVGGKDELSMLQSILDHRYGEKLPTVITSNLKIEAVHEVLGPRLADRLTEATFRHLVFNGPSSRPTQRNNYFSEKPSERNFPRQRAGRNF